jgi:hypothetical protein
MERANTEFKQLCGTSSLEVLRSRPAMQLEHMQVQLLADIAMALVELNETLCAVSNTFNIMIRR